MYNFVKGNNRLFVKGSREDDDPDNIADPNEHQLIHDHSNDKQHYEFNSKNHMASASQESREIFHTAKNRNGLRTVHTQKIAKKITSVNRGEQRKLPTYSMIEGNKLKEKLMKWAQKTTRGYPGVNVCDFTNSWRDGLAYNAIIHRNRPDLVDYHKCKDQSDRQNLQTAFDVLSRNFGINPSLTADEIVHSEPNEDEMIKYLSAIYELFPDPPDHNPLWDAEKIRRIDEYKDSASRLLVWLREVIPKLNDRNFPNTLPEMFGVKKENDLFKTEQIPPKLHDKQRLASSYEDVLNMARSLPGKHVRIEDEYDIRNIENLWKNMITAHQKREHDIDEEIGRLERLEKLAEKLVKEIDICDHNLENIKKQIIEEEKQVLKQDPLKPNFNIDNIQRNIAEEEGRIKNMYNVLKILHENKYHRVEPLANQVDYLYKKWKNLKTDFENNVVKVLNERKEAALRRPKTEEELINENEHFRFVYDCLQKVLEKRKYLESLNIGEDVHTIQRRLEQFNEEMKEIKQFQSKIDECHSRKVHIKREELPIYNNLLNKLLTAYDDLQTFTRQRINHLQSLLDFVKAAEKELAWLSSKEEIEVSRDWSSKNHNIEELSKYHYNLVKEMESREREFNKIQDKGESLIKDRHPSTKLIENLMARMQYSWSWLLQLINCFEQHLKYTGDYYNFMEDVSESKKLMNSIEDKLNNQYSRQHISIEEGEKMLQELQTVRQDEITKISSKINDLEEKSGSIVNMKQRKLPLPHALKVKSLCMVKSDKATITKNEMVTLLDNSQRNKWKIRTNNNSELNIPSACFVIPPPDPDVMDALAELKNKLDALIALWAQKYRELRQNQVLASLKLVKDWDYPYYCSMDPVKRDKILKALEDDINNLAREGPPDDPKIKRLQDEFDDIKKKFAEFEERRRREEEEKKNQAMVQKFIESANDLLEKLQEKERTLVQRAQNQIPREMQVLENLIVEHNEFEHDLSKYESKIKHLKEEFYKISSKSHAAQSKYEAIIETWDRVCTLSKLYSERLKALQTVLIDVEQAASTLNEVHSKLVLTEEIPADEIGLSRLCTELKDIQTMMASKSSSYDQLLSNVTKVRRLVERTRPKQSTHSDLNRLEEDVKTLYKKWNKASIQIKERLSALELCNELLKKYRSLMNVEKTWLNQTSAKVQTMLNRDLEYVTRIYESLVERKPAIEETNVAGSRYINETKSLTQKIKIYRDSLEDYGEISAKRPRKYGGVEIVEQELDVLNNEYKNLLDKVLSYLNQLQDDESRMREFNSKTGRISPKDMLLVRLGNRLTDNKDTDKDKDNYDDEEEEKEDSVSVVLDQFFNKKNYGNRRNFQRNKHLLQQLFNIFGQFLSSLGDDIHLDININLTKKSNFPRDDIFNRWFSCAENLNSDNSSISSSNNRIDNRGFISRTITIEELPMLQQHNLVQKELISKLGKSHSHDNEIVNLINLTKNQQVQLYDEQNSIADKLKYWLDQKEKLIQVLGPIGSEPYVVNSQLRQINVMKDEFSSQEHLLNKMDKLGGSILDRMDRTNPYHTEVHNKMNDIHKTWKQLLAILDEREKNLLLVNEASIDFQNKLAKLQENLDAISDEFDRIVNSDLEKDEQLLKITNLEESLEAQRPLLAELGNACNNLCNLLTDNASKNEIRDKFKYMDSRYNDLARKISNKKTELQSTIKEDREFFMSCDQLQEWLRNMLNVLSKDIKISAIYEVVTRQINDFEPIYQQVMDKEHEVHMVINRGNNLLQKTSYRTDTSNWRQTLDNIKRQWDLVKKEALEKKSKLHKCLDICREFNQNYNDLYPLLEQYENRLKTFKDVPLQRSELENRMKEIQVLKSEISKKQRDFDNIRNLADQLLSVADTDKDHVKNKMNQLKELWDRVNAEILRRNQQIESILKKFLLYKDSLKGFNNAMQRIEDKMASHQSFTDQKLVDRMKNLLDEARSLRDNLDAVKGHAADLINEVKNEKASRKIEMEVKDAEERYRDLMSKLEDKCRDLDALSNNVKAFTLKLTEIQNQLNQLEQQLNNMAPIARNIDILKNQLVEIKDFRNDLEKVNKKLKEAEQFYKSIVDQDHSFDNNMYRYQLDNLNRQLSRLDDASQQRLNNILAMMDKLKQFYDDYGDVDKNLNDVMREIDNLKPISRDVDAIRAQQNEFRNLNANVVEPLARRVDDLMRKANGLIQSALPGVDTSKMEQDTDKMNNKWNNLKDKINDRERKLDSAIMQAGRFQDALDAFEKWLKDTENLLANQKPPSSDYKILKSQIQEQQFINKMVNDREGSLRSLKELGQDFMKNLDSNEKYHVENQLNDLSKRFNILKNDCDKRLNLLKQIYPIAQAFSEKAVPLQEWLDNTERKLSLLKHSMPIDQDNIKSKIHEHQIIHQDVLNHRTEFERLTEIAQNLINLLTDEEAQVVVDKSKELTDRYAKLVDDSLEFAEVLNESKEFLDNFLRNFDDLFNWMDKMENRVNKHKHCAVSVDKIREQIDDLQDVQREIQFNEPKIYEVFKLGQNFNRGESIVIKQKIEQLQLRFNELKRKSSEYMNNLKEVLPVAQNFYNAHDKLNAWMDLAEKSLKNLESQSLKQQESTIRTLENQINENKQLIDVINNLAPQFCNFTNGQGTAHVEGIVIKDNRRFNNICDQINRQVDKIDGLKQRNNEVVNDIDELYEWFKDVERQLLEAEGIPHEPKKLALLLKETKALYDDINSQKGRVRDVLANVKKLVRNNNTEDMIHIREKSEELKDLANHVSQLCLDRLNLLEQALPLAEYFFEAYNELNQWLDETENETQRLGGTINAIRIKQQQEIINHLTRSINEHKPVLEKLNKTGQSLINIVQEKDAKQVKRLMDDINERFNNLKLKLRDQQLILDSALQETSQFTDKLDGLLRTLMDILDQLKNAEPISAHPERIREQIHDNDSIIDELSKRKMAYETVCQVAQDLINKGKGDDSIKDIYNQHNKLKDCWNQCNTLANNRKNALNDAMKIASKFWQQLDDAMNSLKDIERAIASEEQPACEPNAVARQQEFLKEIKQDLDSSRRKIDDCKTTGRDLIKIVGEGDKYEIKKNIDDLENYWNKLANSFGDREKNLKNAMDKAMRFHEALQNLLEFLDKAEDTFSNFGPVASDLKIVKKQVDDLNGFKRHVDSHLPDVENFNRLGNELLECVSSAQAKSIREPMHEVNQRWDDLSKAIANRQAELENALLKLGQFEQSLNDFLEWMAKTERILDDIKPAFSDPQVLEIELSKFKVLENDIYAHQSTVDTLNAAGKMLIDNERGTENARATQHKLNNLNSRWQQLLDKTEQRKRELEELLKEAHSFNQELLDMISWINDMDNELSVSKPVGGLPETAREQLARFMEIYQEIEGNRFRIDSLIDRGNEYLKKSKEAPTLQHNMKTLKSKWENLLAKANDKKIKLEIALAEAIDFHNSLEKFVEWLTEAEKYLNNLQPVSRVMERITKQIEEHKNFQKDLSNRRESMMELDKKGTHLKYFSQKQDVILIKNLLVSVQHRWEKVVNKTAERSRSLDYGFREVKEFYDAWNDLMNWLNDLEKNFDSMQQISNNSDAIRQLIQKHREFQRQLGSKNSQYDQTLKMGKNLKEKAPKIDVPIIQNMIDELKNKWNSICNKSVDRQRKLEEALLFSGQFKDAIDALLDWLDKAREQLLNNLSVYGDLDTVTALVEQHKIFLEEFKRREKNLQSVHRISDELLKSSPGDDSYNIQAEIASIDEKWKEVEQLSKERSMELEKAVIEAEKLHKAVNILLEWLSDAEMKLRFSGPMPEDEDATREQIAEHETFLEEMAIQEKNKDSTVKIAQDILNKCHPEAVTVIKHWITIIQSRWEEVNSWAKQREQRLQDHLESLLNIMDSLEKALAWLIGAEAALLAAETQPLPDDNNDLLKLIEEHDRFLEELEKKGVDIDKIAKTFAIKKQAISSLKSMDRQSKRVGYPRSSTPIKIPSDMGYDVKQPKVKELMDKYNKVNKLAQDRKKRLQDKLDYNNEVERIKNFDFDEWRKGFLEWMNNKKARVIDFFKKIDSNNDGRVTKMEFIEGFVRSKFATSRLEMEKVAEIFDRNNDGYVDHKEYIDTLRPERDIPKTESEIIQDEVQKQVDKCSCHDKYQVFQVGECKYRFGESQKLRLVRILRSTVMVRVGGGWISLDDFLKKNDPCRAKGRTNIELRETLAADFDAKGKPLFNEDGTISSVGPITKIKEKTDRSLPMSTQDQVRFTNNTSDYSFSDHADSSGAKSRPRSRLTISSNSRPGSRHSSQPPSRAGSDLSIDSLDISNPKLTTYKFTSKTTTKKANSRQNSYSNLRDKLK